MRPLKVGDIIFVDFKDTQYSLDGIEEVVVTKVNTFNNSLKVSGNYEGSGKTYDLLIYSHNVITPHKLYTLYKDLVRRYPC